MEYVPDPNKKSAINPPKIIKSHSHPASLPLLKGIFHLNILSKVATDIAMINNPAAILEAKPARRARPPTNSVEPNIKAQKIPGLNPEPARKPAVAFRFFNLGTTNRLCVYDESGE